MALTGEQIRNRGLAALRKELGRAGLVRFLQHFEAGTDDYTKQRASILESISIESLRTRVQRKAKK